MSVVLDRIAKERGTVYSARTGGKGETIFALFQQDRPVRVFVGKNASLQEVHSYDVPKELCSQACAETIFKVGSFTVSYLSNGDCKIYIRGALKGGMLANREAVRNEVRRIRGHAELVNRAERQLGVVAIRHLPRTELAITGVGLAAGAVVGGGIGLKIAVAAAAAAAEGAAEGAAAGSVAGPVGAALGGLIGLFVAYKLARSYIESSREQAVQIQADRAKIEECFNQTQANFNRIEREGDAGGRLAQENDRIINELIKHLQDRGYLVFNQHEISFKENKFVEVQKFFEPSEQPSVVYAMKLFTLATASVLSRTARQDALDREGLIIRQLKDIQQKAESQAGIPAEFKHYNLLVLGYLHFIHGDTVLAHQYLGQIPRASSMYEVARDAMQEMAEGEGADQPQGQIEAPAGL